MKLEIIKEFAVYFGAVEAVLTFVYMFGCAIEPGVSISAFDAFMGMLLIVSGSLLFFTNFDE